MFQRCSSIYHLIALLNTHLFIEKKNTSYCYSVQVLCARHVGYKVTHNMAQKAVTKRSSKCNAVRAMTNKRKAMTKAQSKPSSKEYNES